MGTDVSYLQSFAPTASVYLPTIQFVMFPPRTKQRSVDNENNYTFYNNGSDWYFFGQSSIFENLKTAQKFFLQRSTKSLITFD